MISQVLTDFAAAFTLTNINISTCLYTLIKYNPVSPMFRVYIAF